MPKIFLSYANEDEIYARALKQWLSAPPRSWDVFAFGEDMNVGEWRRQLSQRLQLADLAIVLHSEHWARSVYCREELGICYHENIPVAIAHTLGSGPESVDDSWLNSLQQFTLFEITPSDSSSFEKSESQTHQGQHLYLKKSVLEKFENFARRIAPSSPYEFEIPPSISEPYPGLRPLNSDEAGIFFGRDREIRQCLLKVREMVASHDSGMFTIDGPSGAGKSSFLRAGILARLLKAKSEFFVFPLIVASSRPVSADGTGLRSSLSKTLVNVGYNDVSTDAFLSMASTDLGHVLRTYVNRQSSTIDKKRPIIIAIDQGEELVSAREDRALAERRVFFTVLQGLMEAREKIFVISTVREEFYTEFVEQIREVHRSRYSLDPINKSRYEEIITHPLGRQEFKKKQFSETLIHSLKEDAWKQKTTNALPLLAFTLQRLWSRSDSGLISESEYKGLQSAITETIEEAVLDLKKELYGNLQSGIDISKQFNVLLSSFLFGHFVRPQEDGSIHLQRCLRNDLRNDTEVLIAEKLLAKRVLVGFRDTTGGEKSDSAAYELAHEDIVELWPWFREEAIKRREELRLYARLKTNAERWEQDGRDSGSAIMNVLDQGRVREIAGPDISNFSETFKNLTGVSPDKKVQEFVDACETIDEEKKRRERHSLSLQEQKYKAERLDLLEGHQAELEKKDALVAVAKRKQRGAFGYSLFWAFCTVLSLAGGGYGMYHFYTEISVAQASAIAETTEQVEANLRSARESEQAAREIERVEALKEAITSCWEESFFIQRRACSKFHVDFSGDLMLTRCDYQVSPVVGRVTAVIGNEIQTANQNNYTLAGSRLLMESEGDLKGVYSKCQSDAPE